MRGEAAVARALGAIVADPRWIASAKALKRDARCHVLAGDAPGFGPIVVKVWRLTRAKDILARAIGATQALRHWRGAEVLPSLGVATAEPLAALRRGASEMLIMRRVDGLSLLEHIDEVVRGVSPLTPRERAEIARAVGGSVRALADRGWFNRDHKPSNLIVDRAPGSAPRIVVIDAVGLRRDRLREGGLRMLTSLMLEPMGVGRTPPSTLRMRALLEASDGASIRARKSAWRAVAQAIDEHGDPTPKINPLAQRPG